MKTRILIWMTMALVLGWTLPAPAGSAKANGQKAEKRATAAKARTTKQSRPRKQVTPRKISPRNSSSRQSQSAGSGRNLLDNLKRKVRESKKKDSPRYDHFRDADHDGVSDRVPRRPSGQSVKKVTTTHQRPSKSSVKKSKGPRKTTPKATTTRTAKKKTP